jgi:hypothetical protein
MPSKWSAWTGHQKSAGNHTRFRRNLKLWPTNIWQHPTFWTLFVPLGPKYFPFVYNWKRGLNCKDHEKNSWIVLKYEPSHCRYFFSGTQYSTLSDKCLTRWVKVRFLPRISPIRQYSLCNNTRKVVYIGLSVQRNASCFILQTLYNSPFSAGCLQMTGNYEELRLVKAVTSWKSTTFVCPVRGHGHLNDLKVITLFLSIQVTDDWTCINNSIHVITILRFILFLGYFLCYVHYVHVPMPNYRH